MTVRNITDINRFFEALDYCDDDLTLITPDGRAYDWRENRNVIRSILTGPGARVCDTLELKLSSREDRQRIICYMVEGEALRKKAC